MTDILNSYIGGQWVEPTDEGTLLVDAATGEPIVRISAQPLDYAPVLDYARTVGGPALLAMSQSAHDSLTPEQRQQLGRHAELLPLSIPTIETLGGGSVRCMLAEVFLPEN